MKCEIFNFDTGEWVPGRFLGFHEQMADDRMVTNAVVSLQSDGLCVRTVAPSFVRLLPEQAEELVAPERSTQIPVALRDAFAASIATRLLTCNTHPTISADDLADRCYKLADALLRARKRT